MSTVSRTRLITSLCKRLRMVCVPNAGVCQGEECYAQFGECPAQKNDVFLPPLVYTPVDERLADCSRLDVSIFRRFDIQSVIVIDGFMSREWLPHAYSRACCERRVWFPGLRMYGNSIDDCTTFKMRIALGWAGFSSTEPIASGDIGLYVCAFAWRVCLRPDGLRS